MFFLWYRCIWFVFNIHLCRKRKIRLKIKKPLDKERSSKNHHNHKQKSQRTEIRLENSSPRNIPTLADCEYPHWKHRPVSLTIVCHLIQSISHMRVTIIAVLLSKPIINLKKIVWNKRKMNKFKTTKNKKQRTIEKK